MSIHMHEKDVGYIDVGIEVNKVNQVLIPLPLSFVCVYILVLYLEYCNCTYNYKSKMKYSTIIHM